MTIAEFKLNGIKVNTEMYCYTSHLIYHQLLYKGCNTTEEFERLTAEVFGEVPLKFNKLLEMRVKKSWKHLPLICFQIYTVGNWIQTRIDEGCWMDPYIHRDKKYSKTNNLGIWIGILMAVGRKSLEMSYEQIETKYKFGHQFDFEYLYCDFDLTVINFQILKLLTDQPEEENRQLQFQGILKAHPDCQAVIDQLIAHHFVPVVFRIQMC